MAKFCTKCGEKTVNGKCPKCVENVSTDTTTEDIKGGLLDCVNIFKKVFTKPFEAVGEYVKESKVVTGIIMIILTAASAGLYRFATLKSTKHMIVGNSVSSVEDMLKGVLSKNLEPDYFKEFMNQFADSLALYAALVVIGWIIISKLFKGTASIKEIITAAGLSLSVVLIANLVNSVVIFIDGEAIMHIIGYVFAFASSLSCLLLYASIKEISGIDKNKFFIAVATMSVSATIIIDIVKKIFE